MAFQHIPSRPLEGLKNIRLNKRRNFKNLVSRSGPSNITLNMIMPISIGGFLGVLVCILTIHYFVRKAKRRKMGLPTRRRRQETLAELEAYLPPPGLNTAAAQIGPNWRGESMALQPAPACLLSRGVQHQGKVTPLIRLEKRESGVVNGEGTYEFIQGGERRIEIKPQRPPRPEETSIPDGTNDFRSILVPSRLPSPKLPPSPAVRLSTQRPPGEYSPTQTDFSMPSPSISSYHSPATSPGLPQKPPMITPKSPLRNQHAIVFPPRSPPPNTAPPQIPPIPQSGTVTQPQPVRTRSASNRSPSSYTNRQETSFQDAHHYRQSISSTNMSSSERPSEDNPILVAQTVFTANASIKLKTSKHLRKINPGHRRTKTQDGPLMLSNIGVGEGLHPIVPSPEAKEGGRQSKANSMILQLASVWDPDSSGEDLGALGRSSKKKKKGNEKEKVKEKEGIQERRRKGI